MVDFSFISARFLGADDADGVFAAPGEHHPIDLCIDPAECDKADLFAVFPVADPLHDLAGRDFGSGQAAQSTNPSSHGLVRAWFINGFTIRIDSYGCPVAKSSE